MKTKLLKFVAFMCLAGAFSCKEKESPVSSLNYSGTFPEQGKLDSLKSGLINLGTKELNDDVIRQLQYQKKAYSNNTNGVVIAKSFLTQSVNGFSESGINIPIDTSNYSKWDFLVVYPGLAISENGEEKLDPCVYFYKGGMNSEGKFVPVGKPLSNIKFLGGGGGDGVVKLPTPPPSTP